MDGDPLAPRRDGRAGVDLTAIWNASLSILLDQVAVIERAVVAGIERRLTADAQEAAGREAHKLAGSLGTFGRHEGSRLARALELALASGEALEAGPALGLSRLVMELQAEVVRPLAPSSAPPATATEGGTSLLVVDSTAERGRRVVEAAAGAGWHAAVAASLADARALVNQAPPDAVVLRVDTGDDPELAPFLAELGARRPSVASILVVGHAGADERARSAHMGAGAVLEEPAPPDAVVQAVARVLARDHGPSTVLAVDDDATFLVIVREVLGAEGFAVESLSDTADLWATLEAVEPDLLLLDNDMPGLDGLSLCRAIRSDNRWSRLPIVFLSGSGSPEAVRAMFAAGADDFVPKPLSVDDLVTRVVNRIQRTRAQTQRLDVDLATGLPTERAFLDDATRLLSLARQDGRPAVLAVAELRPARPPKLAAFGRRLRQSAAPEDAVGAWAGGRLAALLYGVTAAEAQDQLRRVVRAARAADADADADTPSVAVGIAGSPDNGTDVRTLGAVAERALARALAAGDDAVEVDDTAGPGRTDVVDVLLVDDDEALGTLVVHALNGRGWSVRWLRDGAEAVELVDQPGFRARAMLLDVGLPGLDGLSVLRHMARQGRLRSTRVVMLTVRANEGEVLESLELGAFDHVAKPFSLSVLMHRVRRAVDG